MTVRKLNICKSYPTKLGEPQFVKLHNNYTFKSGALKEFAFKYFKNVYFCTLEEENLNDIVTNQLLGFKF